MGYVIRLAVHQLESTNNFLTPSGLTLHALRVHFGTLLATHRDHPPPHVMTTNRRDFLKQGTLVADEIATEAALRNASGMAPLSQSHAPPSDPVMDENTHFYRGSRVANMHFNMMPRRNTEIFAGVINVRAGSIE